MLQTGVSRESKSSGVVTERLSQPSSIPRLSQKISLKIAAHVKGDVIGGFGAEEFSREGAFDDFDEFRGLGHYYVTQKEPELLRSHADICAAYVKDELLGEDKPLKVTIVSRGPGSAFKDKEGILVEAFQRAGIEIEKVVLIDKSVEALRQSVEQVRDMLPDADVEDVNANIFKPEASEKYTIAEGTVEVGMCFGLTPANINGLREGEKAEKIFEKQLRSIRGQMQKGAFFFANYDHNPDPESCENAYEGREKMVRGFFREVFGIAKTDDIKYQRQHDIDTGLTHHIAHFQKRKAVQLSDGMKWIAQGLKLHFNLSYKPSKAIAITANQNAGFAYPNEHKHPAFDNVVLNGIARNPLAIHACRAA